MIRKGQVQGVSEGNILSQVIRVSRLFEVAVEAET